MRRLNFKKTGTILAVIILLVFLHFLRITAPLENALVFLLNPFAKIFYNSANQLNPADTDLKNINWENEIILLRLENKKLTSENTQLKTVAEENEALRRQLNFLSANKYQYVLAGIISRGSAPTDNRQEGQIVLDRGKQDGLKEGQALVDSDGVIVGKIISTEDHLARACLTTASGCKFSGAIQNQTKTIGLTEGDLGLTIKMDFIPQTENLRAGDTIVTSGLEDSIPRGLIIGKIINVNKGNNEIFQNAIIEPLANLNQLSFVSAIIFK